MKASIFGSFPVAWAGRWSGVRVQLQVLPSREKLVELHRKARIWWRGLVNPRNPQSFGNALGWHYEYKKKHQKRSIREFHAAKGFVGKQVFHHWRLLKRCNNLSQKVAPPATQSSTIHQPWTITNCNSTIYCKSRVVTHFQVSSSEYPNADVSNAYIKLNQNICSTPVNPHQMIPDFCQGVLSPRLGGNVWEIDLSRTIGCTRQHKLMYT